jgi:hypothetical protein
MAKLIMMRHKVRSAPFHTHSLTHLRAGHRTVKPSQYPPAAYQYSRPTYSTSAVHVTHTASTTSTMDPHPQTYQSTTPLTGIISEPSLPASRRVSNVP